MPTHKLTPAARKYLARVRWRGTTHLQPPARVTTTVQQKSTVNEAALATSLESSHSPETALSSNSSSSHYVMSLMFYLLALVTGVKADEEQEDTSILSGAQKFLFTSWALILAVKMLVDNRQKIKQCGRRIKKICKTPENTEIKTATHEVEQIGSASTAANTSATTSESKSLMLLSELKDDTSTKKRPRDIRLMFKAIHHPNTQLQILGTIFHNCLLLLGQSQDTRTSFAKAFIEKNKQTIRSQINGFIRPRVAEEEALASFMEAIESTIVNMSDEKIVASIKHLVSQMFATHPFKAKIMQELLTRLQEERDAVLKDYFPKSYHDLLSKSQEQWDELDIYADNLRTTCHSINHHSVNFLLSASAAFTLYNIANKFILLEPLDSGSLFNFLGMKMVFFMALPAIFSLKIDSMNAADSIKPDAKFDLFKKRLQEACVRSLQKRERRVDEDLQQGNNTLSALFSGETTSTTTTKSTDTKDVKDEKLLRQGPKFKTRRPGRLVLSNTVETKEETKDEGTAESKNQYIQLKNGNWVRFNQEDYEDLFNNSSTGRQSTQIFYGNLVAKQEVEPISKTEINSTKNKKYKICTHKFRMATGGLRVGFKVRNPKPEEQAQGITKKVLTPKYFGPHPN